MIRPDEDSFQDAAETEEERKIAEQLQRRPEILSEDTTRSTLHTGKIDHGKKGESADQIATPDKVHAVPQTAPEDVHWRQASDDSIALEQGDLAPSDGPTTEIAASLDWEVNPQLVGEKITPLSTPIEPYEVGTARSDWKVSDTTEGIQSSLIPLQKTDAGGLSVSEVFTVEVTDVNEGPEAISLAANAVAENSVGAAVGTISVVDPDAGDSHSFSVSDDRFEVADGELRLKPGVALDYEAAAEIQVEVTATDAGGLSVSEVFTVEVVEMPDILVGQGFQAQYFDMNQRLRRLDDIDWSADPTHQEVTSEINYSTGTGSFWEGGSRDTFGVRITGNVEVSEAGAFTFFLGGDDGATLFVNGVEIIDNDGLHGFRTRTGEVELDPGTHHIEVRYFENFGHAGLKLEWEGPGLESRGLVTAPDVADAQTLGGLPLVLELEVAPGGPELASLTLAGLPEGSLVSAGADAARVEAEGTADITNWDTDVLTITAPPDFSGQVDASLRIGAIGHDGEIVTSETALPFKVSDVQVSAPIAELKGGFHAKYYDMHERLRRTEDVDWDSEPTFQEFVSEVNYANGRGSFWEGGAIDTFGAKITGEVTVNEGGEYTFFVGADDGVVLYVDGVPVINNDGLHGYRTRTGELDLAPGSYTIEIRYFENYGHAGLKLEWEGPDTSGRETVRADVDTSIEENGTLEAGISLANASNTAKVDISGMPEGTIVISGDQSAVSDGGIVDLDGWDLATLEISPPPGFEGVIDAQISVTDTAFNGATVSSSTEFKFEVGDIEMREALDVDSLFGMATTESPSFEEFAWNALQDGFEGDDTGDIMTEPVVVPASSDIVEIGTDTVERSDW